MTSSVRTVTLSDDMVDSIMREELQFAVVIQKDTDESGNDITDYKLRDHLLHSLAYYSFKTEFFAFCESQNIDPKSYWDEGQP